MLACKILDLEQARRDRDASVRSFAADHDTRDAAIWETTLRESIVGYRVCERATLRAARDRAQALARNP